MENEFHIILAYQEPIISSEVVADFEGDIQSPGLNVRVESLPMMGARAGIELLLPTLIVVYFLKPYFESFLSEMGKDHYAMAKRALLNVQARIKSKLGGHIKIFVSEGKRVDHAVKFSPFFSIEAQSPLGYRVKLLIQTEIQLDQFNLAVEAYLRLMAQSHGIEELSEHSKLLLNIKPTGPVLLVCYDAEKGELKYVNPIPERKQP
ncbi:hypothetical protein [Desulfurivibrio sp. C05AmB]|uniref:hypothetical protein n=1 Tax=Desulfurivibrio sp. C05AmB TaxID=3374371 RepID=UPI00376F23A0